jgi:hypothetical protein
MRADATPQRYFTQRRNGISRNAATPQRSIVQRFVVASLREIPLRHCMKKSICFLAQ